MSNTYWNSKGRYEHANHELEKLIPDSGEVVNKRQNPKLEKYRIACNCYYDYYNNGLYNRCAEFSQVFRNWKLTGSYFKKGLYKIYLMEKLDLAMDEIILEAAAEQGVCVL